MMVAGFALGVVGAFATGIALGAYFFNRSRWSYISTISGAEMEPTKEDIYKQFFTNVVANSSQPQVRVHVCACVW